MNWKYTDASQTIAIRDDGRVSCLASELPQGTVVAPYVAPPVLSISARQLRLALTRAGLRASVESAVAAGTQDLKDWYECSMHFEKDNPMILAMATTLNQPASVLDSLWELGATL